MFYTETPSPYGRRGQTGTDAPGRQKAAKGGNELAAICRTDRLKFAAICRLQTKSFHMGHALLLVKTRILHPTSSRFLVAECPRHSPACCPHLCPVHDGRHATDRQHSQAVRVPGKISAASKPCPQPVFHNVRDRVQSASASG